MDQTQTPSEKQISTTIFNYQNQPKKYLVWSSVLNFILEVCSPDVSPIACHEIEISKESLKKGQRRVKVNRFDCNLSFSSRCTKATLGEDMDFNFGSSRPETPLARGMLVSMFDNGKAQARAITTSVFEVESDDEDRGKPSFKDVCSFQEDSFGKKLLNTPCLSQNDIKNVFACY